MNWGTSEILLLNLCGSTISFAVNWFLQSTLLIAVGLSAAWLFRKRGSAFQSAVYRTTLLAVLVGPLVSLAMAYGGLDGWSIKLPSAFAVDQLHNTNVEQAPNIRTIVGAPEKQPISIAPQVDGPRTDFVARDLESPVTQSMNINSPVTKVDTPSSSVAFNTSNLANSNAVPTSQITTSLPSSQTLKVHTFGWLAVGLSTLWMAVFSFRSFRLTTVMWRTNQLRKSCIPASSDEVTICQRVATKLNIAIPLVLRSPFLTSPFLHGIRRPAVLLPEDIGLPLQDIFVHELAHLQRRDCFWLLLRQVTTSVFFFQPLLHWLGVESM